MSWGPACLSPVHIKARTNSRHLTDEILLHSFFVLCFASNFTEICSQLGMSQYSFGIESCL